VVDVQRTLQAIWGLDRITTRREQSLPRVQLFAVQKTSSLAGPEVFAFVGLRNVLASYRQKVTLSKRECENRAGRLSTPDLTTPLDRIDSRCHSLPVL
jgi:hypothetical protein